MRRSLILSARRRARSFGLVTALLSLVALVAGLPANASAQEVGNIQIEQFEPLPDQYTNILNVATSDVLPDLGFSLGAMFHFVKSPLRLVPSNNASTVSEQEIIENQFKGELWAGIGFFNWVDIGVVIPLVLSQSGQSANAVGIDAIDGFAVSDIRIVPRGKILPREWAQGFGIGFEVPIYLPTGDQDSFNGEGFRAEPRLILDFKHDSGFEVATNVGYLIREEQTIHDVVNDDVLRLSLATAVPMGVDGLQAIGSVFGSIQTADARDASNLSDTVEDFNASPVEALIGARYTLPFGLHGLLAGGAGLNSAVGSPQFRILASVGYLPLDDDADDDGLKDDVDECPNQPEDPDGFEDENGCPDLDNDNDTIPDTADDCPMDPEDMDGFEDENGCPDPDNDADLILDTDDSCPNEAEDVDTFEDEDGCPDPDNDGDGVLDVDDACAFVMEDPDGFEDEDGCPDPDNDMDGVLDGDDNCPLEPEVINGFEDEDGCPDKGPVKVVITDTKVEIMDKVFFDTSKTTIKKKSFDILDQVAQVLKANPQITKIRVEGHTDSRGRKKTNQKLSDGRAAAVVDYLVGKGVDPNRLVSAGYGPDHPIDSNKSKTGRANNRRVEFTLLEVNGEAKPTEY